MQSCTITNLEIFRRKSRDNHRIYLIIKVETLDETKGVGVLLKFKLETRRIFGVDACAPSVIIQARLKPKTGMAIFI